MAETNPYKIKKLDSRVRNFSSDKWHKHDKHIVFSAVREKFLQNPFLKAIVLNSGSTKIAESSMDTYWGTGIHIHDESALDECFWNGDGAMANIYNHIRQELSTE